MSETAKIDSVYIPNVQSQDLVPLVIADRARVASGALRQDTLTVKRRWKLSASSLTSAQVDAILDLLYAKSYGAVAFWLDKFGAESTTVAAYVTIDRVQRAAFGSESSWENNGAHLEMTIEEQ